jgi:hypothetical protein
VNRPAAQREPKVRSRQRKRDSKEKQQRRLTSRGVSDEHQFFAVGNAVLFVSVVSSAVGSFAFRAITPVVSVKFSKMDCGCEGAVKPRARSEAPYNSGVIKMIFDLHY